MSLRIAVDSLLTEAQHVEKIPVMELNMFALVIFFIGLFPVTGLANAFVGIDNTSKEALAFILDDISNNDHEASDIYNALNVPPEQGQFGRLEKAVISPANDLNIQCEKESEKHVKCKLAIEAGPSSSISYASGKAKYQVKDSVAVRLSSYFFLDQNGVYKFKSQNGSVFLSVTPSEFLLIGIH